MIANHHPVQDADPRPNPDIIPNGDPFARNSLLHDQAVRACKIMIPK